MIFPREQKLAKRRADARKVLKLVSEGYTVNQACTQIGSSRNRIYREFRKMRLESQPGKDDLLS